MSQEWRVIVTKTLSDRHDDGKLSSQKWQVIVIKMLSDCHKNGE
jgi:methylmalonyl-CoA mutase cobalamin-binding subunit